MNSYSGVNRDDHLQRWDKLTISHYNTLSVNDADIIRPLVYKARRLQAILGGEYLGEQVLIGKLIQIARDVGSVTAIVVNRPRTANEFLETIIM